MKNKILLFGVLAEKVGKSYLELEKTNDVEALKKLLFEKYPELEKLSFQISVNQAITHNNIKLKIDDEVALLPPFAGG